MKRGARLLDSQPLHAIPHGPEGDAEELRRRGTVVARLLQRLVDRRPLHAIEIILQRPFVAGWKRRVGLFRRRRQVQVVGGDVLRVRRQ